MKAYCTCRKWRSVPPALFIVLFCIFAHCVPAQAAATSYKCDRRNLSETVPHEVINLMDTLLHYSLPPVEIEGQYKSKNQKEEDKYHQLYLDIKRVYPLSKIVSREVKLVNEVLDSVYHTTSEQKKYLKWYEKHIYHTYLDTLKSLNARQTKLFIKLINRETGSSPYELVKKYRGGLDAFLWQMAANGMLLNLKKEYDPREDARLEEILVKFFLSPE